MPRRQADPAPWRPTPSWELPSLQEGTGALSFTATKLDGDAS
ncbi:MULTISPECIES: hypothetical protein [Streptomyces]|nr:MULTISPECIES: hypothetical protein [Streptomyces]